MALFKKIRKSNGLELSYHRIAMVKIDVNQQTSILVHSYLDEESRNYEKRYSSGEIEGEPTFPYVDAEYRSFEYGDAMNVGNAYEWLKKQPEFNGAEDI